MLAVQKPIRFLCSFYKKRLVTTNVSQAHAAAACNPLPQPQGRQAEREPTPDSDRLQPK